jgi:cyclophilin family peptidyl-prolyl cis-trans isomerase/HEAT repeat protein
MVTPDQKLGWVLRLEQQRVTSDAREAPSAAVARSATAAASATRRALTPAEAPNLAALTLDPDVTVRRRALVALGRIGLAENTPVLASALLDDDEFSRAAAAFSLGLLGGKGSVPPLLTALGDASPLVRGRAAEALGLIGDAGAAAAIAEMAAGCRARIAGIEPDDDQWPKAPEIEACRLSLFALVRLHQYDALAKVALDADGTAVSRWWPVAYALQRIGDARAVPALLGLASGTGTYTRAFALRGVAAAGDRRVAPMASALAGSADADVRLRVTAVRALAELHNAADLPALLALLRDRATPPNLALEAVTAMGAIGDKQAFEVLLDLWTHPWAAMRAAAIAAAAKVNPAGFLLVVSSLGPDKEWSVRSALAGTLARLPADQVRSAIEDLCDDADVRVRGQALDALAHIDAPDLTKRLTDALNAPDVMIRATAARLLGEKRLPDGVARLMAAYARGASDTAYAARAAALDALAKYGGTEAENDAKATIRRALGDPDWAIRVKAADLLRAMGEAGAAATPPAPLRLAAAAFESAALLHPVYSPHAFIETRLGTIEVELNVVDSPLTTQSFIERARAGFFNGLTVHRLVPNFVIQTGDPRGDGEGGPGYTLRDELSPLPYRRGTVGMALDWRETGGSQFFITVSPQPHLDGKYTVFGQVVKGEEILDRISQGDIIERVTIWDGVSKSPTPPIPDTRNPK